MIQWATVLFYFSDEEVLIASSFPSIGGQKSSMLGFSYFTEGAPPYGKNQKVDRFIKRLQRKIKLFPRHILLSISASTGRVNVPADSDTIEKAFSRDQNRRIRYNRRALEVKC